ncbi:MAG: hypothetical protein J0L80_01790 [Chitinophagales bacterium]|nr:hypothetical protein [Chitinophagales bacterium]
MVSTKALFGIFVFVEKYGETFSITYNGQDVNVQPYTFQNRVLFAVGLPQMQLIVTKTFKPNGTEFWTSMPQGNQKLAEAIGKLIDDKMTTKQKTLF